MFLSKPHSIRCLLILACLIALLVFQLPGVSSSKAGAALSRPALGLGQPRPLRQESPARAATGSRNYFWTRFPGLAFAPTVTATKTAALFTDADSDSSISPGDTLKYTVTINDSGTDATGLMFDDTPDTNTTF